MPLRLRLAAVVMFVLSTMLGFQGQASAVPVEKDFAYEFGGNFMCQGTAFGRAGSLLYGYGCLRQDGDYVVSVDMVDDGQRVATHWVLDDGSRQGICINALGSGLPGIRKNAQCNKNFPENTGIAIRMGRCNGSVSACLTLADYNNWSGFSRTTT